MRLKTPRIAPLRDDEWTPEQAAALEPLKKHNFLFNIFRTMARRPEAFKPFGIWGDYVLRKTLLPAREKEIVILRTGFLCGSAYEWAQHAVIGRREGLTDVEIARIKAGADAPGWSAADAALIRAADDLHKDQFITAPVWDALITHFGEGQAMDVVYAAGQYTLVSMILNTFGVQPDEGLVIDPDLDRRA